jgi:uncharacterized Zn finger protein (UPF0148 family)
MKGLPLTPVSRLLLKDGVKQQLTTVPKACGVSVGVAPLQKGTTMPDNVCTNCGTESDLVRAYDGTHYVFCSDECFKAFYKWRAEQREKQAQQKQAPKLR